MLLKSVIQAIPCYTMNCFRLPKGLIHEIHQIMARFWWNGDEGNRKIHWVSWQKMCRPKCFGGMGFKNLGFFNQSLLAKQCWRIVNDPSSLLAVVIKGRYFPREDFFSASIGSNPSFIWRSLLWGRELLRKGLRWKVGNGSSIPIYGTNWLPRDSNMKICSYRAWPGLNFVSDLMTASGQWNENLLHHIFSWEEASLISEIPVGQRNLPDRLIWHYEKSGFFSVRSGYRLAQEEALQQHASSSSFEVLKSWWAGVWKLNLPSKIKIFLWRLCLNKLPTRENLLARGLDIHNSCSFCGRYGESCIHIFWDCKNFRRLWARSKFDSLWSPSNGADIFDILCRLKDLVSGDDFEFIVVLMWGVWFLRNGRVNGDPRVLEDPLVWSERFISVYREAQIKRRLSLGSNRAVAGCRWFPPSGQFAKLNSDAAFIPVSRVAAAGVVVRDQRGEVLVGFNVL